jgi:hypothetical protein
MAYVLGTSFQVDTIVAGTNVTISPTAGKGIVTINSSGGGGGGGGITNLVGGSNISITNTSTINVIASGIPTLVAGGNISITNTSTISVLADPRFTTSMGFTGLGTTSILSNVVYPYGTPQYYPYVTNSGTDVLNTIGGKQFWATLTPGSTTVQVMRYGYEGIQAQQGSTGSTIPFLFFNNTTGLFGLSNTSNVVNKIIAGAGTSIASTGAGGTGDVTIYNTTTAPLYGTAVLTTDTIIYNTTDYIYWTSIADAVNVDVYSPDTRIVRPTQSGIYHVTWNINVLAAFITGGANFVITTKPGVIDTAGTTFTGKNGGTCDTATYTGETITDIICVSGMTQISFDRTTDRGFAIQYTVNTVTPGTPPNIPLIAITNDAGALNYTQATITIHKLDDLPAPP